MLNFLTPVLGVIDKVIDKAVTDKDQAKKLKHDIQTQLINSSNEEMKAARDIIVAEAQAGGPAASWRPHLMYLLMFILFFNAVAVPLINVIWGVEVPVLDALGAIPDKLWNLITIALGGYIGGRTLEKTAMNWKSDK